MAKKIVTKKTPEVKITIQDKTKKKKYSRKQKRTLKDVRVEKALVDNFVALQQVMTNLSFKLNNLSDQISKLLQLFEISAKTLAEKDFSIEKTNVNSEKIAKQMDTLLEQNKIIARGMTLINDKVLERNAGAQIPTRMTPNQEMQNSEMQGYQRSISSNQGNLPPRPLR